MKIQIVGLPQAGQQELFGLLTGIPLETIRQKPLEVHLGICQVKDPRITKLSQMFNPKKTTYAKIEYALLPDFSTQGPTKTFIFNQLKNADEICWVVREEGALAEINNFVSELIIYDLMLVEKRVDTIDKEQRRKMIEGKEKEKELLLICKQQLEAEKPLALYSFHDDQIKTLRAYQFFTLKPLIVVVNSPEDRIKEQEIIKQINYPSVKVSAELEEEISKLDEAERAEYMKELGIDQPALDKMNQLVFKGLGLISFFTVGEDEVRAWPVRKGASAAEAGGSIHSDIAKGFVRAELMKYDDFLAAGSEAKLKELGKFYLKGRDYIVEDSDLLSFRFNV